MSLQAVECVLACREGPHLPMMSWSIVSLGEYLDRCLGFLPATDLPPESALLRMKDYQSDDEYWSNIPGQRGKSQSPRLGAAALRSPTFPELPRFCFVVQKIG